ncbi:16S rRNA (cytidine(1402)-2'-O)-methyltransferase [Pseudogemmobacter sonorensis]|uniref:16S rRNA (cytidine(1402)-2'-O)-methyltransferase n=1 Tax=Pseudogemmobacter sonorensis TaxID=2989681 RepID=UPI003680E92D
MWLVATPIGAARDITLRALDILAGADMLAAEDTRTLRHLMEIHGIALAGRPLLAVHDHNEAAVAPRILGALAAGKSVAYASEAGTPLVSDPGFVLARAAAAAGHPVHAAPGASAVLAALSVAGLPTDRFLFAGFPPASGGERRRFLAGLAQVAATVVLYESPRRVARLLGELAADFGADRPAALCRELTKRHEEVIRGTLATVSVALEGREIKGEVVLVIDRAPPRAASPESIQAALEEALKSMSVKDAVSFVAQDLGVTRKLVYRMALDREG